MIKAFPNRLSRIITKYRPVIFWLLSLSFALALLVVIFALAPDKYSISLFSVFLFGLFVSFLSVFIPTNKTFFPSLVATTICLIKIIYPGEKLWLIVAVIAVVMVAAYRLLLKSPKHLR